MAIPMAAASSISYTHSLRSAGRSLCFEVDLASARKGFPVYPGVSRVYCTVEFITPLLSIGGECFIHAWAEGTTIVYYTIERSITL